MTSQTDEKPMGKAVQILMGVVIGNMVGWAMVISFVIIGAAFSIQPGVDTPHPLTFLLFLLPLGFLATGGIWLRRKYHSRDGRNRALIWSAYTVFFLYTLVGIFMVGPDK